MGSSAPKAPDPMATAQAQGQMNKETAIAQAGLNATNQVTPYGNLTYTQSGMWSDGTPQYTATTTLSPIEQQKQGLADQAQLIYGQTGVNQLKAVQDNLSQPVALQTNLDVSSLGGGDGSRKAVEDALFARINPSLNMQRDQLETKLRNQGIMPGTEAWSNAMRDVAQSENDARLGVVAAGGQEQSRLYDTARANQEFENQALLAQRVQPLNEASALLNGSQVTQPQFTSTPTTQVSPVDYSGLVSQQYGQRLGAYQSNLAGLYGLGSAALGAGGRLAGGFKFGG